MKNNMRLLASLLALPAFIAAMPAPSYPATTILKRATDPNNTCGPNTAQGFTCDPNSANGGPCCSQSGWCGKTDAFCGDGCQAGYSFGGKCDASQPPPSQQPTNSPQCGVQNGQTCNPVSQQLGAELFSGGPCCSKEGFCGTSSDFCLPARCDSGSGKCYGSSDQPQKVNGRWQIDDINTSFQRKWSTTFNQESQPGDKIEGWIISEWPGPPGTMMQRSNVHVTGGFLNLKVPKGQTQKPYNGAEVSPCPQNIVHGSFRMKAIFSDSVGTCAGHFLYHDASGREIDFEYLNDPNSSANKDFQDQTNPEPKNLHFTNYDAHGSKHGIRAPAPSVLDLEHTLHEYRVDWLPGRTLFYLDGVLLRENNEKVPNGPGPWLLNHWTNGDPTWSAGPPVEEAVMKVQSFEMYYDVDGQDDSCTGWQ